MAVWAEVGGGKEMLSVTEVKLERWGLMTLTLWFC